MSFCIHIVDYMYFCARQNGNREVKQTIREGEGTIIAVHIILYSSSLYTYKYLHSNKCMQLLEGEKNIL